MIYNNKNFLLKNSKITLILFFFAFSINSFANNPDETNGITWKAKIFSNIDNSLCINILDTNDILETKIIDSFNYALHKVEVLQLFKDDTITIYKLVCHYPIPEIYNIKNLKIQTYVFFFFKSPSIFINNLSIKINKAVYPTKFSTFYEVAIHDTNTNKSTIGMISFVDENNLKLTESSKFPLDCSFESRTDNIDLYNKLIKIGSSVAKQTMLQSMIQHDYILNSKQTTDEINKNILPIPSASFLDNIFKNERNYTMKTVLSHMHGIASAIDFLHKNNIAHGDISIMNLFMLNNKLILSGLEYFSEFQGINDETLGVKFVRYPGNMHYPPEFRNPLDENKTMYRHASFEGDVWSLGLVMATMLYNYYRHDLRSNLNKLIIGEELDDYNFQQDISSSYVIPYYIMPLSSSGILRDYITRFIYFFLDIIKNMTTRYAVKDENFNTILDKLIEIINACHHKNPKLRLTANTVTKKLATLINNYTPD